MQIARWQVISGRRLQPGKAHQIRGGKTLCGHYTAGYNLEEMPKVDCGACIVVASLKTYGRGRRTVTHEVVREGTVDFILRGRIVRRLPDGPEPPPHLVEPSGAVAAVPWDEVELDIRS